MGNSGFRSDAGRRIPRASVFFFLTCGRSMRDASSQSLSDCLKLSHSWFCGSTWTLNSLGIRPWALAFAVRIEQRTGAGAARGLTDDIVVGGVASDPDR